MYNNRKLHLDYVRAAISSMRQEVNNRLKLKKEIPFGLEGKTNSELIILLGEEFYSLTENYFSPKNFILTETCTSYDSSKELFVNKLKFNYRKCVGLIPLPDFNISKVNDLDLTNKFESEFLSAEGFEGLKAIIYLTK